MYFVTKGNTLKTKALSTKVSMCKIDTGRFIGTNISNTKGESECEIREKTWDIIMEDIVLPRPYLDSRFHKTVKLDFPDSFSLWSFWYSNISYCTLVAKQNISFKTK